MAEHPAGAQELGAMEGREHPQQGYSQAIGELTK
jgi:hypothetical protein